MSVCTVGIIGHGFVGQATAELRSVALTNIYDPLQPACNSDMHKRLAYESDIVMFCVPTPEGADGAPDLSILDAAVATFFEYTTSGIAVIRSTIPAGTTDRYCTQYNTTSIIHFPEFLTERTHIRDFHHPTDIVLGGHPSACETVADLLRAFYKDKNIDINVCTALEAELTKTIRNSFYATKVAFMNEIYELSTHLGVEYNSLESILTNHGKHPWWGPQHTKVPGPDGSRGFGGKCFPKDTKGLATLARTCDVSLSILEAAIALNDKLRQS